MPQPSATPAEAPSLLLIAGALRRRSTNRRLAAEAARLFGPARADWADLRLPLYDGDLEDRHGIPDPVRRLAGQIAAADAVVIATPEYNKAIPGVLKNALDWVSRTSPNPWAGKPVAIMSATAGRSGGERAQASLRLALAPFRVRLVPGPDVLVADSGNAFDAAGRLVEPRYERALSALMQALRDEVAMIGSTP